MSDTKSKDSKPKVVYRTYDDVLQQAVEDYFSEIDLNNPPEPRAIVRGILQKTNDAITVENNNIPVIPIRNPDGTLKEDSKGNVKVSRARDKWPSIRCLAVQQLVDILLKFHNIIKVDTIESESGSNDSCLLAVYCSEGFNEGIYDVSEDTIYALIRKYAYSLPERTFIEIYRALELQAPRRTRCCDKDLIAVNNGIFNYHTKQLMPFTPELVFLTKSRVNYNPDAVNVNIHNDEDGTDWNVEDWMHSLSDDPEIVDLLWKMLGAIIRPHNRWNKSIWLYSTTGNNGKGTLCELMRNLCGPGVHTSVSIAGFNAAFGLESLITANAVITDENDVGKYIDCSANLKAAVTNDIIQIDRKFKKPISFRFWGFIIQCINDLPMVRDKSDSFYRRQILVPMEKCFTGKERSYIKDDYLSRQEVLEYVMKKVLLSNYYKIEPTARCTDLLGSYKNMNDPVREFITEFYDSLQWDLVPVKFLYDLFKAWNSKVNPGGIPVAKTKFTQQLQQIITEAPFANEWVFRKDPVRIGIRMNNPEPLIVEYNLTDWKNSSYTGLDKDKISTYIPTVNSFRSCLLKTNVTEESGELENVPLPANTAVV